jgi:endonuclease YncB( thermonuclease family)
MILTLLFSLLFSQAVLADTNKPAAAKWITLTGCQFVPEDYNDGDSFHVWFGRRELIFRLYFVDAPETEANLKDRIKDQAEYFGVSPEQVLQTGVEAKQFTEACLKHPFTVTTRWQNAMGRSRLPRYYAQIKVSGQDLAALLVSRGLARAKGTVAILPGGGKGKDHMAALKKLEVEAKVNRTGIWAHSAKATEPTPAAH